MYSPSSTATLVKPIFAAEKTPVLLLSFTWHHNIYIPNYLKQNNIKLKIKMEVKKCFYQ